MKSPTVSVLVLNYNGVGFLKECFDSLLAASYPNTELILVDNNSTDNSVDFVRENYKDVKILQTGSNAGYSRAYNLAFREAAGDYFVLLNNDVKVAKNWLEPLVYACEQDAGIAAVQPKIRSLIDEGYFEYAGACGGFIDRLGYPFLRGRLFYTIEKDTQQYQDERDLFWTSGAAMFVRASALKKSRDLDEEFVHHMEEIDLCWRLLLCGYRLRVIPSSVIYHYAGATIAPESYKKLYWNHRNNIIMLIKNLETKHLPGILMGRYFLDFVNIFAALLKFNAKHSLAIILAHIWIIMHPGLILKKRREVQKIRQVPDESIKHLVYQKSIVFDYFARGIRSFSDLRF